MKQFVRLVCLILVFAMLLAMPVYAAETADPRGSNYFARFSTYFWHTSGYNYQIWFEVTAVGTMDELGVSEIEVEYSTDEVNWDSAATFYKANYSQMVDKSGSTAHAGYVPYTCTSGYYYRARVVLYAKDDGVTATKTVYTTTLDLT